MSTILIADDEARIRRLVSDFLKRDGHTILEAADGREAMQMIENRRAGAGPCHSGRDDARHGRI